MSTKISIESIVDQVFNELKDIYSRALAIERPTKKMENCKKHLCNLHKDFRFARSNFKPNKKQYPKVQLFLDNLSKMCDIAAADAVEQISKCRLRSQLKKDQDISFLHDQRNLRKFSLDKEDKVHSQKSEAKINRDSRNQQLATSASVSSPKPKPLATAGKVLEPTLPRLRSNVESTNQPTVADNIDLDDTKNDAQFRFSLKPDDDPDYVQSRFLKDRPKKKNIITPDSLLLKAGDRAQLSSRKLAMVAGAALVESGEDLNDHVFSHPTIARNRPKMRAKVKN